MLHSLRISTDPSPDLRRFCAEALPEGRFQKILLKPNWVLHASKPEFPIEAMITSSRLIEAVIDACLEKYPDLESLIIGDVPLQSCDFDLMCRQSGIADLKIKYARMPDSRVRFLDLRREIFKQTGGYLEREEHAGGDPSGYAEIILDERSQLDAVSHRAETFRVSDYDPEETKSVHRKGSHRYLIARSVLEADLVINLPKMKTHQKSGVTGALKNLVGINGSKACLVHHQLGKPSRGGDEFPDDAPLEIVWQVRLREVLQKRSQFAFRSAKPIWELVKVIRGIKTVATRENLQKGGVYVGAGSWYGNDSIWRMVYDLNLIIQFGKATGGCLSETVQRTVISIMDGVIAGEGNGPLQSIPVVGNVLLASRNPFLVDFGMAKLMGFDWRKIRLLSNYRNFSCVAYTDFAPGNFRVILDGKTYDAGIDSIPTIKPFIPPPGWVGHIEAR